MNFYRETTTTTTTTTRLLNAISVVKKNIARGFLRYFANEKYARYYIQLRIGNIIFATAYALPIPTRPCYSGIDVSTRPAVNASFGERGGGSAGHTSRDKTGLHGGRSVKKSYAILSIERARYRSPATKIRDTSSLLS